MHSTVLVDSRVHNSISVVVKSTFRAEDLALLGLSCLSLVFIMVVSVLSSIHLGPHLVLTIDVLQEPGIMLNIYYREYAFPRQY